MRLFTSTGLALWFLILFSPDGGFAADFDSGPKPVQITERERRTAAIDEQPFMDPNDPPHGRVVSDPEWAPAESVMIGWMWFNSYFIEVTRACRLAADVQIIVETSGQETSIRNMLTAAGVPLDGVEFLRFALDTCWIVDYAPFFISTDGTRELVDQMYPGRPDDDAFPTRYASAYSIPSYSSDLRIEGGNFIPDGQGVCFTTSYLFEQNAGYLSEDEVRERMQAYCGCDTLHVLEPLDDYTGHIDMFAKLIDPGTMLIGQYEPGDPEYQKLENNAEFIGNLIASTGSHYTVVRIPMPGSTDLYWTYTNGLILNDHVFVPTYRTDEDATAITVYEELFPESTVVGIDSLDPIEYGGAIHCTTKAVPALMPSPSPDPSPPPTVTPPPSPTPTSPASSPTATPTGSPSPTVTRTAVPSPTPTGSCGLTGSYVWMPSHDFTPGDVCRVDVDLCNSLGTALPDTHLFVILDVHGSLFFAPSFGAFDFYRFNVAEGETRVTVIPPFVWPDGTGSASGLMWYAGMTDPGMSALVGTYSTWEFGWVER